MELTKDQVQEELQKTRNFLKEKGLTRESKGKDGDNFHCYWCDKTGTLKEMSEHQSKCDKIPKY